MKILVSAFRQTEVAAYLKAFLHLALNAKMIQWRLYHRLMRRDFKRLCCLCVAERACSGRLPRIVALTIAFVGGSTEAIAQIAATPTSVSMDVLITEGAIIYRSQCARCHGKNGEGQRNNHDAAPRLGGNFARLSVTEVTVQIIQGGAYMPPFRSLTNRDIASVATYIRNSFGNDLGMVTVEQVAAIR